MFVGYKFAIYFIYLLDIQCTTFYIENMSVKKANSHFTICSKFTPTLIIFTKQKVSFLVWASVLHSLMRRVKNI